MARVWVVPGLFSIAAATKSLSCLPIIVNFPYHYFISELIRFHLHAITALKASRIFVFNFFITFFLGNFVHIVSCLHHLKLLQINQSSQLLHVASQCSTNSGFQMLTRFSVCLFLWYRKLPFVTAIGTELALKMTTLTLPLAFSPFKTNWTERLLDCNKILKTPCMNNSI